MKLTQPGEQEVIIGSGPVALEPGEELVGLLDDRQVGAEVGVEHGVEAQHAAGR